MDSAKRWWLVTLALLCGHASAAASNALMPCTDQQLLGVAPSPSETEAHRQFALPAVDRPHGPRVRAVGQDIQLRIDREGRPVCFRAAEASDWPTSQPLTAERLAWTTQTDTWRYAPFIRDGKPVEVVLEEKIREQILPARHRPMPQVRPDQVRILLTDTPCEGWCPDFSVEVHGDGTVIYKGNEFVDVMGTHTFQVSERDAAELIKRMRELDIWSMNRSYAAMVMDAASTQLEVTLGKQKHVIYDGSGEYIGMPVAVTTFQHEVRSVGRVGDLINLSTFAVQQLKQENFPFRSRAGADLLARAITNNQGRDEQVMLDLIDLGVPIDKGRYGKNLDDRNASQPMLDMAMQHHRARVVDALLARGVLDLKEAQTQAALDSAFQTAIGSGNATWVERIWNASKQGLRPSLWIDERSDSSESTQRVSVITLIQRSPEYAKSWDGLSVARWLVAHGCDVHARNANGDTLLHIAAGTDDISFVQWVLDQGLPASIAGDEGSQALGWTYNEDVALLLLSAGTNMREMEDRPGFTFRDFAKAKHWGRVMAWLDSH